MDLIQNLLRERLQSLNLLMVTGGFVTIVAELLYTGHINGSQMIGFYAAVFGVLLGLHSLLDSSARKFLATAFLLLALFGLLGAFQHFGVRKTRQTLALVGTQNSGFISQLGIPPLLAPLSISGLAFLGMFTLLATVARKEEETFKESMYPITVSSRSR
jgi:hypothetical protein